MSESCPTRFQNTTSTDSTVTFSHVILCQGLSLDGPGRLSTFEFSAVGVADTEVRIVSNPDRLFVDAGLWVWPGHSTFPRQVVFLGGGTTTICVDDTGAIDAVGPDRVRMGLRLLPNPAHDVVWLDLHGLPEGALEVDILSSDGRRVNPAQMVAAGHRQLALSLKDLAGVDLPAGTYFVRARAGDGTQAAQKLVVVR